MHRIDGQGAVNTLPTPEAVGPVVGYFADADAVPPTQVTGDWLNSVQEEIVGAIGDVLGESPDKTDNSQLSRAIQHLGVASASFLGSATTSGKAVAIAVDDCGVFGENSAAIAATDGVVNGDRSVLLASDIHPDDTAALLGVDGNDAAAIAVVTSGAEMFGSGDGAAVVGSFNPQALGLHGLIAASADSYIDTASSYCAVIGSEAAQNFASSGASPAFHVVLASRNYIVGNGAAGLAAREYAVSGGYHASTSTGPSWRIESDGGVGRFTGGTTNTGLDYAEMFQNGDGRAQEPGRMLVLDGAVVRRAKAGQLCAGVVSVCPGVLGGDDALGWAGRFERDEWGRIVREEVEVEREVLDEAAQAAWRERRKRLFGACQTREQRKAAQAAARATKPPRKRVTATREQQKLSASYDPTRLLVPRSERPDEWTPVALVGQVKVALGAPVSVGDLLMPDDEGRGVTATREYKLEVATEGGVRVRVMEITSPFDAERGYGIALCLVR